MRNEPYKMTSIILFMILLVCGWYIVERPNKQIVPPNDNSKVDTVVLTPKMYIKTINDSLHVEKILVIEKDSVTRTISLKYDKLR